MEAVDFLLTCGDVNQLVGAVKHTHAKSLLPVRAKLLSFEADEGMKAFLNDLFLEILQYKFNVCLDPSATADLPKVEDLISASFFSELSKILPWGVQGPTSSVLKEAIKQHKQEELAKELQAKNEVQPNEPGSQALPTEPKASFKVGDYVVLQQKSWRTNIITRRLRSNRCSNPR